MARMIFAEVINNSHLSGKSINCRSVWLLIGFEERSQCPLRERKSRNMWRTVTRLRVFLECTCCSDTLHRLFKRSIINRVSITPLIVRANGPTNWPALTHYFNGVTSIKATEFVRFTRKTNFVGINLTINELDAFLLRETGSLTFMKQIRLWEPEILFPPAKTCPVPSFRRSNSSTLLLHALKTNVRFQV